VLAKEEEWSYALPKFEEPPATVAISLDGTCLHLREDGVLAAGVQKPSARCWAGWETNRRSGGERFCPG
jgi:hypothetical protein